MKFLAFVLFFPISLFFLASPAEAARVTGDIVSTTPAAPVWGDQVLVDLETDAQVAWLEVDCGSVFRANYPAYGYAGEDVVITLTPHADPVDTDCQLTYTGTTSNPGGNYRYRVLDTAVMRVTTPALTSLISTFMTRLSVSAHDAHWGDVEVVTVSKPNQFVRVQCVQDGAAVYAAVKFTASGVAAFQLPSDQAGPAACVAQAVVVGQGDWRVRASDDFVVT